MTRFRIMRYHSSSALYRVLCPLWQTEQIRTRAGASVPGAPPCRSKGRSKATTATCIGTSQGQDLVCGAALPTASGASHTHFALAAAQPRHHPADLSTGTGQEESATAVQAHIVLIRNLFASAYLAPKDQGPDSLSGCVRPLWGTPPPPPSPRLDPAPLDAKASATSQKSRSCKSR